MVARSGLQLTIYLFPSIIAIVDECLSKQFTKIKHCSSSNTVKVDIH
jgi:hypothetical protein